jgi:hypothetical protein
MIRPAFDEDEEKPLDPAVENVRKKLVRFVAINLGLLLIALMAVVAALVYKSRTTGSPQVSAPASDIPVPPGSVLEAEIPLPAGAKIISQSLSGNRIAIDVEFTGGGRSILVYDIAERRIIGRFTIGAQ